MTSFDTQRPHDVAEFPLVEELLPPPDPEVAFLRFAALRHCVFFDSARRDPKLGRYSFLAAEPFEFVSKTAEDTDAIGALRASLARYPAVRRPELPPFQAGAAAMLSYELGRQLETLPTAAIDEFSSPALAFGLYDTVVAWDHERNQAWLISQGFPEIDLAARRQRAEQRIRYFRDILAAPLPNPASDLPPTEHARTAYIGAANLAPQFPMSAMPGLTSNMSASGYIEAVRRAIEYIRAGDIFQVNLAQRLLYPAADDTRSLYLRLRRRNPATFAGYFDWGPSQIASASPERFLRVVDRHVETRPIKGTRLRTSLPEADFYSALELMESEKDRAENVMIVDLLRNDLSRVCTDDSVFVSQLCKLESYEYVQHLVSSVEGLLRPEHDALDALIASFPGGSITGAPKIRAMQIIAELEPTARGPYCGSLAYFSFDGSMDASILIRTITAGGGWWQAPVGGGITSHSDPAREYEETWHKAEGMLRAFKP
ncbi:MAG: anthranilate synthase component I family protein [Planctomycetia bacterium]|nr:anthranilate synthase component I family protein [Planctomycetia bacterium]